jgi:hypothetical protein
MALHAFGKIGIPATLIAAMISASPATSANPSSDQLNQFWLDAYGSGLGIASATPGAADNPSLAWSLLSKAQPDECFDGMGEPYPPGPPCDQGQPKVNESYVFGLTKTQDKLWFGTAPNMLCLVLGGDFGLDIPIETDSFVCEFGNSQTSPPLPSNLGDFRPPHIYTYDLAKKQLVDMSAGFTGDDLNRLNTTYGLRAAGTLNNVVLLAGPGLGNKTVNIFAYRADNGQFLGSRTFSQWGNVRDAKEIQGALYFAMQETAAPPAPQGSIQRWVGTAGNPFQFNTVGTIPNQAAAFLAEHQGRIYASTWYGLGALPGLDPLPEANGIYMSPPISSGGLSPTTAAWKKVFSFDQYENDPLVARTYFGGAMASFGGYLYFGTINNPLAGIFGALLADQQGVINLDCNGDGLGVDEILTTALGTFRPISVFRGKDLDTPNPNVELLYGSEYWPSLVHRTDTPVECDRYEILPLASHRNNLGQRPSLGFAGLNNFFNAYTWTMTVHDNRLFLGTFDWSSIAAASVLDLVPRSFGYLSPNESINAPIQYPPALIGADLFRFENTNDPAAAETLSGFGNWANYGVRSMTSDGNLYVGTGNPFNLRVAEAGGSDGGWELIELASPARSIPSLSQLGLAATALLLCGIGLIRLRRRTKAY